MALKSLSFVSGHRARLVMLGSPHTAHQVGACVLDTLHRARLVCDFWPAVPEASGDRQCEVHYQGHSSGKEAPQGALQRES